MVGETEVPHYSEVSATSDMKVTPSADTKTPTTGCIKVTPLVDIEVISPVSTQSSIHTDEGFLRGPNDLFVLTGYVDYVACRLWQREVYIIVILNLFIIIIDTL